MLDAQPFSTPHTDPSVKGFVGQLSGYFDVDGASGRIRPDALFGQNDSVRFTTALPAASRTVIRTKSGSPEKSFTRPLGRALVRVLFPSWMIWVATTGSL